MTARAWATYGAAGALSLIAAVCLLELWNADLGVPFDYQGDALWYCMSVKSTVEHGWYHTIPLLGAPGVLDLHAFSEASDLHFLFIKLISALGLDWAVTFNVYFLLGFPLITLAALRVFRHFAIGRGPAMVGSLLFAFLPSRLIKGEGHLFLDCFFQVPLAILVILWVCGDRPPLFRAERPRLDLKSRRSLAAILICCLTAGTGVYYAFFTGCLLVVGGIWASLSHRSWRHALAGAALTAVIVTGLAVQTVPKILHGGRGAPAVGVSRSPADSEVYGLKIATLLLPVDGHRVPALASLKDRYNNTAPLVNENSLIGLGLVGAVGFLGLLFMVVLGARPEAARDELGRPLAVLNLMSVLLATIGGFGTLFAYLVSAQIRTYARMNVFIGFLALFAVVRWLDRLARRRPRLAAVVLPAVLVLGLVDQTPRSAVRPYRKTQSLYASDEDLVRRIEARVGRGSMIFQLPTGQFHEGPNVEKMQAYDSLRPYLHSRHLRWSSLTVHGTPGEGWLTAVSTRPPGELLASLTAKGFEGLLVDRFGYADHGRAIEGELRKHLAAAPLVSRGNRFAFFDLRHRRSGGAAEPRRRASGGESDVNSSNSTAHSSFSMKLRKAIRVPPVADCGSCAPFRCWRRPRRCRRLRAASSGPAEFQAKRLATRSTSPSLPSMVLTI